MRDRVEPAPRAGAKHILNAVEHCVLQVHAYSAPARWILLLRDGLFAVERATDHARRLLNGAEFIAVQVFAIYAAMRNAI